jgi:hypothetical protein
LKKENRERSLGAVPTSPRQKHRVISGGNANATTAAEAAVLRRRTSPGGGGALGRSNSADDPNSRKAVPRGNRPVQQQHYDADVAAAAMKARLRDNTSGAQVPRRGSRI